MGLSSISGDRFVLGIGAGGLWEEIVALGVPRLSPGERIRALEEAILIVRALSGGGDPVTFEGRFYQVAELSPSTAPTPQIWIGALGPKALGVTGRNAGRMDTGAPCRLAERSGRRIATHRRRSRCFGRERPC